MPFRVMFVDDDPALLNSLRRNLFSAYDLTTAESGSLALEKMQSSDPFEVIMTDMKMPGMDGVEFIQEARKIAPDTIYLMLTGNQDVNSAIRAVNDGSVFRFLNKPCEVSEIRTAVDAAVRQYQLIHAEKELLHKTFVGSIKVLADIVEALHPDLDQQSQYIDTVMKQCESALGLANSWEYRIAARIGLIGLALKPIEDQQGFHRLSPTDPQCVVQLDEAACATARLLSRIPRLTNVIEILRCQKHVDGSIQLEDEAQSFVITGATLLRVATHWTSMMTSGMDKESAFVELRTALPNLSLEIKDALKSMQPIYKSPRSIEIPLNKLVEGMVLFDNVLSDDGAILLRQGRRLTSAIIERLLFHENKGRQIGPLAIVEASCPQVLVEAVHAFA